MGKRRGGFTLIEMLVVIAILVLLMGILLPYLGRAREQARRTRCMANLRSIGQALHLYANTYNDRLVPGDYSVAWGVWGLRTESIPPDINSSGPVNLGYLISTDLLPLPNDDDSTLWCPSIRALDGLGAAEALSTWGSKGAVASISYMFNNSLDGFGGLVQQGESAMPSHKDKVNFLLGDGSIHVFDLKPLLFDSDVGPERLHEVSARYRLPFPSSLLHQWLVDGDVDVNEAREYLHGPPLQWMQAHSLLTESKPVLLANVAKKSLACDVVSVWSGPSASAPGGGGGGG